MGKIVKVYIYLDQKTRMPKKFILHIGGHQSIFGYMRGMKKEDAMMQ